MTDDEWDQVEEHLVQVFGAGPFESFAEVAGVIIKRELLERGLGDADPASLDPDFAGQILIEAWAEAAVHCFPDRDPADVVGHLAAVVGSLHGDDALALGRVQHPQ